MLLRCCLCHFSVAIDVVIRQLTKPLNFLALKTDLSFFHRKTTLKNLTFQDGNSRPKKELIVVSLLFKKLFKLIDMCLRDILSIVAHYFECIENPKSLYSFTALISSENKMLFPDSFIILFIYS